MKLLRFTVKNIKIARFALPLFIGALLAVSAYFGWKIDSVEQGVMFCVGSLVLFELDNVLLIFMGSLPFLAQLYMFAGILSDDFEKASVFIFTRSKKRTIWTNSKLLKIFISIALFWITIIGTSIIFGMITGKILSDITAIINMFVLQFLVGVLFVPLCNVLTLKLKQSVSFLITIIFYTPLLLISIVLSKQFGFEFVKWIPPANAVYAWHEGEKMLGIGIAGFTVVHSVIYILVLIAIVYLILHRLIKKLDLIK